MSVTILDHALIQHKLTIMRDKNTSTYIFKQNLWHLKLHVMFL